MALIRSFIILCFVVTLAGCAAGAKRENMALSSSSGETYNYNAHLKNEVSVETVSGGKATNPAWTSEIGDAEFEGALKLSLAHENLLSSGGRYKLHVKLGKVEQPMFGISLTVTTYVTYTMIDSKTTDTIFQDTIKAKHTASFGDSVIAVKRLRLANEGSAKQNIKLFLQKISDLNVGKEDIALVQ